LNDITHKAIGIDFGGTSIKPAVVAGDTIVEDLPRLVTADYDCAESIIAALAEVINKTLKNHPEIKAVGIGVPGFVDFNQGIVRDLPNVAGWKNIPMQEMLETATGLPVKLENDANAMAYAEWKYGAAKGSEHVVAMTLGTGLGGGLIINNQLVRGHNFVASEIGHISVDQDGAPGNYNNPGGVETYIGNQAITKYAQQRYQDAGHDFTLESCEPYQLFKKASDGDAIALEIWEYIAKNLATVIATLCWALNPEKIVIGGGTANAGKFLFDPLREKVQAQLSRSHYEKLQILPAHYQNDAGKIGSASIALDSL